MSLISEPALRAELDAWAAGTYYPLQPGDEARLRSMIADNLDVAWQTILDLVETAAGAEAVANLAIAPLPAALDAGGQRFLEEATALALERPRLAMALYEALSPEWRRDFYRRFGRERLVRSVLRSYEEDNEFDTWTVGLVLDLLTQERDEAWEVVRALVDAADPDLLSDVAAGPLEDFILLQAPGSVDLVEREATANPRLRRALTGVWIMGLRRERPDLFDRVEAAAGVPLRRE